MLQSKRPLVEKHYQKTKPYVQFLCFYYVNSHPLKEHASNLCLIDLIAVWHSIFYFFITPLDFFYTIRFFCLHHKIDYSIYSSKRLVTLTSGHLDTIVIHYGSLYSHSTRLGAPSIFLTLRDREGRALFLCESELFCG